MECVDTDCEHARLDDIVLTRHILGAEDTLHLVEVKRRLVEQPSRRFSTVDLDRLLERARLPQGSERCGLLGCCDFFELQHHRLVGVIQSKLVRLRQLDELLGALDGVAPHPHPEEGIVQMVALTIQQVHLLKNGRLSGLSSAQKQHLSDR